MFTEIEEIKIEKGKKYRCIQDFNLFQKNEVYESAGDGLLKANSHIVIPVDRWDGLSCCFIEEPESSGHSASYPTETVGTVGNFNDDEKYHCKPNAYVDTETGCIQPIYAPGEWLISKRTGDLFFIDHVDNNILSYCSDSGESLSFNRVDDEEYTLWTIDDMKQGEMYKFSCTDTGFNYYGIFDKVEEIGEPSHSIKRYSFYYATDMFAKKACSPRRIGGFTFFNLSVVSPMTSKQKETFCTLLTSSGYCWSLARRRVEGIRYDLHKFDIGDWIVNKDDRTGHQIIDFTGDCYILEDNFQVPACDINTDYELFSFNKLQPGDFIIATHEGKHPWVGIYKCKCTDGIDVYCYLQTGWDAACPTVSYNHIARNICPAPPCMRNALLNKLADMGYTWNKNTLIVEKTHNALINDCMKEFDNLNVQQMTLEDIYRKGVEAGIAVCKKESLVEG